VTYCDWSQSGLIERCDEKLNIYIYIYIYIYIETVKIEYNRKKDGKP